jgi:hypothetical protein
MTWIQDCILPQTSNAWWSLCHLHLSPKPCGEAGWPDHLGHCLVSHKLYWQQSNWTEQSCNGSPSLLEMAADTERRLLNIRIECTLLAHSKTGHYNLLNYFTWVDLRNSLIAILISHNCIVTSPTDYSRDCVITFSHVSITKIWFTFHSRAVVHSLMQWELRSNLLCHQSGREHVRTRAA